MALDLATLVATRGRAFPLALLANACGAQVAAAGAYRCYLKPDAKDSRRYAAIGTPKR
jgi:hypothetical protein